MLPESVLMKVQSDQNLPILMYHHLEPEGVPLTPYAAYAGTFGTIQKYP